MPANTARGFPYVVPSDHPLEYPALSQQLAQAIEDRGLLAATAVKSADQTGIASGGAAGITCTLPGVRVGAKVLCILQMQMFLTSGSVPSTAFAYVNGLTGATIVGAAVSNRTAVSALNVGWQVMGVILLQATATTVSTGMQLTNSNGGTWTCINGSSITLVSL